MDQETSRVSVEEMDLSSCGFVGQLLPVIDRALQVPLTRESVAEGFVVSDAVFPRSPIPVHDRWSMVLAWVPPTREHGIDADYSTIFEEAIKITDSQIVYGCCELADLQMNFWWFVLSNDLTFRHVAYANWLVAHIWAEKLQAHFDDLVASKRPELDPTGRASLSKQTIVRH